MVSQFPLTNLPQLLIAKVPAPNPVRSVPQSTGKTQMRPRGGEHLSVETPFAKIVGIFRNLCHCN
jgi:hypothetical protein